MTSKDSSDNSNNQKRREFLKKHGFELFDGNKSSHEVWTNPKFEELSKKHNIKLLRGEVPWLTVLPTNLTPIKWQEIKEHVEWCSETIKSFKNQIKDEANNAKLLKEIKENAATMKKWKHRSKRSNKLTQK